MKNKKLLRGPKVKLSLEFSIKEFIKLKNDVCFKVAKTMLSELFHLVSCVLNIMIYIDIFFYYQISV